MQLHKFCSAKKMGGMRLSCALYKLTSAPFLLLQNNVFVGNRRQRHAFFEPIVSHTLTKSFCLPHHKLKVGAKKKIFFRPSESQRKIKARARKANNQQKSLNRELWTNNNDDEHKNYFTVRVQKKR